jgi:eukaryotic-like serine/threonine-protein kinase
MHGRRRRLAGRYELVEVIGRGGMGTVYRATDLVLRRTVAVKVLPSALAEQDPSHVARFERGARAAASLADPGVVAIYDTGTDEATRFIVMECVTGRGLSEILRDEAPLDPARAVNVAVRVADALAAAHAAGIVHRDVKPGNVMVADDGTVKVLDFGIARALDGTTLTQSALVLGTAAYMAPEQALGERVDERADIYSLGCLLYALLTRRPPFTGEAAAAVLHQHVNSDPRPPSEDNRRVSPALDAIVIQMLAKSAAARPQSAAEVRERLNQAVLSSPSTPATVSTAPAAAPGETTSTRALASKAHASRRRHARVAALASVALAIIVIIALASAGGSRRPAPVAHSGSRASSRTAAAARSHTSASRSPAPATGTTAPASSAPAPQASVAGAAGSLTSLVSQEVQAGRIDQEAARQITKGLGDFDSSYGSGHAVDALHKLANLSQTTAMLAGQGHIDAGAASRLDTALASLSSALLRSAPGTPPARGDPGQASDGQEGVSPGKAKKHGDLRKGPEGD